MELRQGLVLRNENVIREKCLGMVCRQQAQRALVTLLLKAGGKKTSVCLTNFICM